MHPKASTLQRKLHRFEASCTTVLTATSTLAEHDNDRARGIGMRTKSNISTGSDQKKIGEMPTAPSRNSLHNHHPTGSSRPRPRHSRRRKRSAAGEGEERQQSGAEKQRRRRQRKEEALHQFEVRMSTAPRRSWSLSRRGGPTQQAPFTSCSCSMEGRKTHSHSTSPPTLKYQPTPQTFRKFKGHDVGAKCVQVNRLDTMIAWDTYLLALGARPLE